MQKKREGQPSESMALGALLTLAGGFQDAYSYNGRGHVFANAQTGNVVLLGQNLAMGHWQEALRYLLPLLAFLAGVFAAEGCRRLFREGRLLHWRQAVLLTEILLMAAAGLFPAEADMPANVLLSLACAMQVESFRKIRGVPCATTMCIGNLRGGTEHLFLYLRTGDPEARRKSLHYYGIILIFAVGASLGAAATLALGTGAIWLAAALLLAGFFLMFRRGEPAC